MSKPKADKNPASHHGVDAKHENAALTSDVGAAPGPEVKDAAPQSEKVPPKSIVPAKYAGKYKNGGSDALARFINEHCVEGENKDFSFDKFFDLAGKNGIAEAHIKPFIDGLGAKAPGVQGRARMTLRNRLDAIVRKNGHIVGLDGHKHSIELPARAPRPVKEKPAEQESAAA